MRVLCVAEKPSIAKSITEILSGGRWENRTSPHKYIRNYDFSYNLPPPLGGGGRGDCDFTVTAVLGHLTSSDFGEDCKKWHSCDPFALFDADIQTFVSSDMRQVERNLHAEARGADLLMIWTDCDREGEHIGSEIAAACRKVNRHIVVKRARFSAIIAAQIHQACRTADNLDQRMADAVEARISLDLRLGAAFTRMMTMTLQTQVPQLDQKVVSYGPCQFPTLGFVVDQYHRNRMFVPETFWYIFVAIEREEEETGEVHSVEFKWRRNHLFDMETAVILYEQCVQNPTATVLKVETKPTTKWKPLPLTTVELQQSGSRLLHMTPKRILDTAEKLYQKGFLSYPRTETDQYDKAFDFNSLIQKQTYDNTWGQYAQRLLDGEYQRPRNGKKNDKAHPPIHPTNSANNLEGDEKRVYELVTRRFLASCSKNAEGKTTTVEIDIAEEHFSSSGVIVLARNYLDVYPYDKWANSALPDFDQGETFVPTVCEMRDGVTSKPSLLTEADLVGLMDKNGIGTDATIAEHIAKIIEREYVTEKQEQKVKYLLPSALGVGLVEGYNSIGFDNSLSKPHMRRETEHQMQRICDGARSKQDVLSFLVDQYKGVYIKAKREFNTVVESVERYLTGDGDDQEALRAASRSRRGARGGGAASSSRGSRGARGGRGGRGGAAGPTRRGNDDDEDDGSDDDDPDRGGGAVRARGAARRGTTSTRGTTGTRGRARDVAATGDDRPAPVVPSRRQAHTAETDEARTCQCGTDAVERTVTKESAHQGRKFWVCSKPQGQGCGFFEWSDESGGGSGPSAGPSRAGPSAPPAKRSRTVAASRGTAIEPEDYEDGGPMRCQCGLEAKRLTVSKDGPNKGRAFWSCPNNPRARCGLFEWIDGDENGDARGVPPRAGNSARGGGSSSDVCYKCDQPGHWASVCPNEPANGRGSRSGPMAKKSARSAGAAVGGTGGSDECYKCHETGHWASACPNEDRDHSSRPGRARGATGGSRTGGASDECYKCHETGHWASACPNEGSDSRRSGPREPTGGGGRPSGAGDECYKCHQTGHWASACPNEDGAGGGGGGRSRAGRGGRANGRASSRR